MIDSSWPYLHCFTHHTVFLDRNLNVGGKIEALIIIESDQLFSSYYICFISLWSTLHSISWDFWSPTRSLTKARLALATLVTQPTKCTAENLQTHCSTLQAGIVMGGVQSNAYTSSIMSTCTVALMRRCYPLQTIPKPTWSATTAFGIILMLVQRGGLTGGRVDPFYFFNFTIISLVALFTWLQVAEK